MILYVTRHGKTQFNDQFRYAGSTNIPLNAEGIKQAMDTGIKLLNTAVKFDAIIASPLIRAMKTAEIIGASLKLPVIPEPLFAERNFGVYEGHTIDEVKTKFPDLSARDCTHQIDDAPTGGETIREFEERILEGLQKLALNYSDKTILLVSHGFASILINKIFNSLSYEDMYQFMLKNCEIKRYDDADKTLLIK